MAFGHFYRAHDFARRAKFGEAAFHQRGDDDVAVGQHFEAVEFGLAAEAADDAATVRGIFRRRFDFAGGYDVERPQPCGVGFGGVKGFAVGRQAAAVGA